MATWSEAASRDMAAISAEEKNSPAVTAVQHDISRWADGVRDQQRKQFQGEMVFPVVADAANGAVLRVERR